ncbi:suppressor protein of bem1/bed5 double mutants-like isoform X2 [Penaeus japonicus]|nr:suppressor protein of bem1/bed5 double mutants-like isoform X2 [Penaeus japonicus]
MDLIASKLEKDVDLPMIDQLYERCNSTIEELRTAQPNPHISASLESLLETLSFQQSLLDSRRRGYVTERRRTVSEGCFNRGMCKARNCSMRRNSERLEREADRFLEVEDMLMPLSAEGGSLEDIAGLHEVKQILREAVVMPLQYPQLFQDGAKPWTRLLLYGPPGTGKTVLARALASELQCPFYCVSSANLLSSWVGESEKLIRELFHQAQSQSGQCVVFIDEIDSLCRIRSQMEDEHSRRVKTELLRQMEDIKRKGESSVFVLGATNCPWDLDPAFLRRFQRRVLVPLPDRESRRAIISSQFKTTPLELSDPEWTSLLDTTEGFSGADLTHLAVAAAFFPIRELQTCRFWRFTHDNKITPCSSDTLGSMQYPLSKLPADKVIARKVELKDFISALQTTPPTVSPKVVQQHYEFSTASSHS